jgi:hypothetical protein
MGLYLYLWAGSEVHVGEKKKIIANSPNYYELSLVFIILKFGRGHIMPPGGSRYGDP